MRKRLLPALLLLAYSTLLIKMLVLKDVAFRIGQLRLNFSGYATGEPNLIPFKTILPYLSLEKGLMITIFNIGGNIGLFVPIGFLLPFVYRSMTWRTSLAVAAITPLAIEIAQVVFRVGIFDIDDVILNGLGIMIGYFTMLILTRWIRERKYTQILIAAVLLISAATAAMYLVYPWGQPVNPEAIARDTQFTDPRSREETAIPQKGDLCGGTGGTGEIISQGNHTITIKSKTGSIQTITLTNQTEIKDPSGSISESDLRIGDRITVVTFDEIKTATTILVCSTSSSEI